MLRRDFSNVKVLLTGATGGIGCVLFRELVASGARVFVTARNAERLGQLTATAEREDRHRVGSFATDLSDPSLIPELMTQAIDWFGGRIDVLINNAGIGYHCAVDRVIPDEAIEVMNVNAVAPMLLCTLALPALFKSPSPKVINISSFLGAKPLPLTSTYTASKHALNGYSKVLRLEGAERGLSVTLIEPGAIDTPFIKRTHDPEAVSRMGKRKLSKLSPSEVVRWVLAVMESPSTSCPEVIRLAPMEQAI